ncbi:MAG: NHLP leader peptide family RiPP precursor [Candidatus Methylacidiphilales bacterium]|nr:NHLP leader peptide family RiPP precursor [Candidatus Methylacidiphilales bacterium]
MKTRKEIEAEIVELATSNPEFRDAFTANPRAVIERQFGLRIPGSVNLHVVQESPADLYLVLPPAATEGKLSDKELEVVAGGSDKLSDFPV